MSKQRRLKKKRDKAYAGPDAVPSKPVIHRYTAEVKSPVREWWDAKKGFYKIVGAAVGTVGLLAWLIFEAARIIF